MTLPMNKLKGFSGWCKGICLKAQSEPKNIASGIDVTVDGQPTGRTRMNTNRKVLGHKSAALRAELRRVLGWNLDNFTTSLFRFGAKYIEEAKPSYISHRPIEPLATIPSIHLLDADDAIVLQELVNKLKMKVPTLINNLFAGFSDKDPSFGSTIRTLNPFTQPSLLHSKSILGLLKKSWVAHLRAIGHCKEGHKTDIYAHTFIRGWQWFERNVITGKANVPLACRRPTHGNCLNTPLNRAGQSEFECPDSTNEQPISFKSPATLLEDKGVIPISTFEARVASLLTVLDSTKEPPIGFIQTLHNLLQHLRTNLLIFWERVLKSRKFFHLSVFGHAPTMMFIGTDTLFKGGIVEVAAEVQPERSVLECTWTGISTILKCLSHSPAPINNVTQTRINVNIARKERGLHSSPALECRTP